MDMIQMSILAIGLSMDSLIIALTSGAIIRDHRATNVMKIAGMLAFIQLGLTVFGWFIGSTFAEYIDQYDHWFAFGILSLLGVRVIYEAFKGEQDKRPFNPLDIRVMFSLAVATSIDAMAVGLSLSLVNRPIFTPAIIVGLVTFTVAVFGVVFGCKVGRRYNLRINLAGGIILILIGSSILVEHTLLKI
ncbi:manganese efflux pump MntP family protein [Dysgonomonas sp. ZJ279]|uniref:manganese efflux pump MntP n=1 Tax=Dysgonomonas sp. ZJ279 TaxID=2709796 RepID=UPI0013EC8947|nr:manganese efflux pump MntP family protein [Dysgonomonas sp. ZJ279]